MFHLLFITIIFSVSCSQLLPTAVAVRSAATAKAAAYVSVTRNR